MLLRKQCVNKLFELAFDMEWYALKCYISFEQEKKTIFSDTNCLQLVILEKSIIELIVWKAKGRSNETPPFWVISRLPSLGYGITFSF